MLVSVPSPRARESARGEAFLHIVWQSRLIRPSELFFTLCAHEVTFGDARIFHLPVEAEPPHPSKGTSKETDVWKAKKKPGGLEKHGVCSQTTRVLSLLAEYDP